MKNLMAEERFNFITKENKEFIIAFDEEINKLGYSCNNTIGSGYCWGIFMIVYCKTAAKSKKVIARIYIREDSIVLRLFFNQVDKHSKYIENTPSFIKDVFTSEHGNCNFCKSNKEKCSFRKTYFIDNQKINKCSGITFEFWNPNVEKLQEFINLLREFYSQKKLNIANIQIQQIDIKV